jgi:hypothetical protein
MEVGDNAAEAWANAEFFFEAGCNQPALSGDSPEAAMIGAVSASFTPAENRT